MRNYPDLRKRTAMSKRAKEKAELIANGIMISVQGKTGRVVYNTKEKSFTHYELMCAAQKGYEQAEKDILSLIESRLSELLGDAQPTPILRYELLDLVKKIKEGE